MKNKRLNIALVITLLIVWGLIIFRLVGSNNDDSTPVTTTTSNDSSEVRKDTFQISGDYPDPFIRNNVVKSNSSTTTRSRKVLRDPNPNKIIEQIPDNSYLPEITYKGLIESGIGNDQIGLIRVENKEYSIKRNDTLLGIMIKDFNTEDLTIIINNSEKTYPIFK